MIAPNGDHPISPLSARATPPAQAIAIAQPLPQAQRLLQNDIFPDTRLDPDLTLIYALLGGTILLLFSALVWSLLP